MSLDSFTQARIPVLEAFNPGPRWRRDPSEQPARTMMNARPTRHHSNTPVVDVPFR